MSGVLAIFEQREDLLKALKEARRQDFPHLEAFSPYPDEELYQATEPGTSPVRWMTLVGGLTGGIGGLALTIWTTLQWPLLITGGKPLISMPPFLIIVFELTILVAALATLCGFLYWSIWGRLRRSLPYDPRFSQGHFGLWIECAQGEAEPVVEFIKASGASEWEVH